MRGLLTGDDTQIAEKDRNDLCVLHDLCGNSVSAICAAAQDSSLCDYFSTPVITIPCMNRCWARKKTTSGNAAAINEAAWIKLTCCV